MNDHDPAPQGHIENLPEEAISELLRGARADQPIPDDVIARLDATLASLTVPAAEQSVVAAKRRRGPLILVAAASVVVVSGGVGLLTQMQPQQQADTSTTAGLAPQKAMTQGAREQAPAVGQSQAAGQSPTPDQSAMLDQSAVLDQSGVAAGELPVVRPAHFVSDAQTALAQPLAAKRSASPEAQDAASAEPSAPAAAATNQAVGCADQRVKPGDRTVLVSFKRATGRLVLTGDHTIALYACDGRQLLHRSLP
ncbi:MAG: hypothetical protein U0R21_01225 [Nocardioidaceae bacterium]